MRLVSLLYCLSGLLSLGYQVAWFRIFTDRFGSTNPTFAFVLCNFIGGLGIGSLLSRPLTERLVRATGLRHPLRVYGLLELLVGATALATLLVPWIPADAWGTFPYALDGAIHRPTPGYRLSLFAASVACVFVPCLFMGATFPLLCRAFAGDGRFPAALYGWNTLGACTGILLCEFALLPLLGHGRTFLALAVANLGLGAFFLLARRYRGAALGGDPVAAAAPPRAPAAGWTPSAALALAVAGGFLCGAFEADVLRRLQFLDCRTGAALSCISFWAILAIFAASWTVRALPRTGSGAIRAAFAAALAIHVALWHFAHPLREWANAADRRAVLQDLPPDATGLGTAFQFFDFGYSLSAVLWFTGLFVFPAFYCLSLLLPHVCNELQRQGRHLGRVYGANTIAFCGGIAAFTFAAPRVNVFYALKLFPLVFLVLAAFVVATPPARPLRAPLVWSTAALLVLAAVLTPRGFDKGMLPPGSPAARFPVRAMQSNGTHTTYVVGDRAGDLLFFDSHSMSGCNPPAQQYMRLMAHFPLLAHPEPRSALLICFGVGSTASAIAAHESIQSIDVVDLNDRVLATAPEFAAANRGVADDPRVRLIHDDGRRFLDLTDRRYDLITSEPPPPMFAGMHRLYSVEYYRAARAHLAEGGWMTQWLPTGQLPRPVMERAIATFLQVFPEAVLFVGRNTNLVLMGGTGPLDVALVERRFAGAAVADLAVFGIGTPVRLLARLIQGPAALRRHFGGRGVVSDQGTGFAHAFHAPADPAVVAYDPRALLGELDRAGAGRLACAAGLARTVLHLGLLKGAVPDFPAASLASVSDPGVEGAGIDWHAVERLFAGAQEAMHGQRLAEAIALLGRALEISEELPHVAWLLGLLQSRAGRLEDAWRTWQLVQRLLPGEPDAHFNAGSLAARLGRRERAIADLQRAVELDAGRQARFARGLGDALSAAGRWPEAIAAYDRALGIDPQDRDSREGRRRCERELAR